MVGSNGHLPNTVEGVVAAVNERGIRIGEDWFNVSKFKPIPDLPARGTRVRITVDLKGFLSTISVLEQPATPGLSRDTTITRLAVLKAAANFVGLLSQTREDIKSEHVLLLADRWLEWAQQSAPDPSEEAF
jgi:hypothetical protein